jgi:hypothetical protein
MTAKALGLTIPDKRATCWWRWSQLLVLALQQQVDALAEEG